MSKAHQRTVHKTQQDVGRTAQTERPASKTCPPYTLGRRVGLLIGLLIVVCAAVSVTHWPALSANTMLFDDGQYLTKNLLVQNPSWASARRFLTEVLEPSTVWGYYQPLTMISLMADYALGGRVDNLRPFHRTSLALHVANTALVIVLFYLLFGQIWIAAGVGLLFGLHPMTVEAIPWVGERKTLLSAFFALWCLILYVRFTRKSGWKLYIGCMVLYVLSLMSKPTSTPLPVLMLLMDFWPLKRLRWRTILEKLPFFVIGVIFAIITYISQSRTAAVTTPGEYGLRHILLVLCHNIIFYLYKIVWPVNLSAHYGFPQPMGLSNSMVLAGVIGTCILIPLLVISLRWTRALLTGWLFFFVAIFPAMGVVGFTIAIASDRFVYLPSIGLLMVLVSLLIWFCKPHNFAPRFSGDKFTPAKAGERKQRGKPAIWCILVAMLVLFLAGAEAVATRRYLVRWRDTVGFTKYMLTLTPNAAPVHYGLGCVLQKQGKFSEAISHFQKTLQGNPSYVEAHNNLGVIMLSQGKLEEAAGHFRQAVQLKPNFAEAYNNLAWILAAYPDSGLHNPSEAVELAERAAELTKYQEAAVLDTLAGVYAAAGQFDRAVTTAQTAIALASAAKNSTLSKQINVRLQLYRQSKPYIEPEKPIPPVEVGE
jgi:cytochrome c-type biogenesis protein CcmH/NrfG